MSQKQTLIKLEPAVIGLYIRTIDLDYSYENNAELAALIQDVFNVECTKEDIDNYQMHFVMEDYEKLNREIEYEGCYEERLQL
jgi:hypothetical protein